ncbi:MAG: type II secretion system F family protein [Candidatus Omnitrophota bacterium]
MKYSYKVRTKTSELISGTIEAQNEQKVIADLDSLGYSIIELKAQTAGFSFEKITYYFKKIDHHDIIVFTRQLATLLKSGTALLPSLDAIKEQTTNEKFKVVLENIYHSVQTGVSFSDSLSKHPKVFSELFISMVKVGETGGILDGVLDRLATLGTQEMELQSRLKSALVYPIVLMVIAFLVVNLLVLAVLPKFVIVFESSDIPLPLITRVVLSFSWILRKLWGFVIIGLIIIGWGMRKYTSTIEGKYRFHQWLLRLPIFGSIYTKIQVSRFARILSGLTSVGIPLLQSLVVVEKTITNVVIRRSIQNIRMNIAEGRPLIEPFKTSVYFSPMVIQMISTGEKSGNLDQMLDEIASFYEPEIEYTIKNLTSLLEPLMLLIMGGIVAFIALSVLLPIFNLMRAFRG